MVSRPPVISERWIASQALLSSVLPRLGCKVDFPHDSDFLVQMAHDLEKLKATSVRQPWAEQIMTGETIEYRSIPCRFRVRVEVDMKKRVSKVQSIKATKPFQSPESLVNADFDAVVNLIDAARSKALISANTILIELYWEIGRYISQKINNDGWGQGTVQHLAEHVLMKRGTSKGFSAQNL